MAKSNTTKQANQHFLLHNVKFVVDSVRRFDKTIFGLAVVYAVFTAISQFVPVFMPKFIIDQIIGAGTPRSILFVVLLFGLASLVADALSRLCRNSLSIRFIAVRLRMIARSGQKFMTMDFQHLENPDVLDLSQKGDRACNNNSDGVEGVMWRLLSLFSRTIVLLGTTAVISQLHPLLLVIIIGLLVVNFLMSNWARRRDKDVNDELAPVWRRFGYVGNVMSDFAYGKDIRLFRMRPFLLQEHQTQQHHLLAGHRKIQRFWLASKNVVAVTTLVQEALMYVWLCWRVIGYGMDIGSFTMYAAAIRTFSQTLNGMFDDISHMRLQNEVISDHRAFLQYDAGTSGHEPLPAPQTNDTLRFELDNVSFRYPGQEQYALRNVSLTIRPGERLAVVGLNGAGKTTFVKLLTRLYEPSEGRLLLNGTDTRVYDKNDYYRLFSVVFQEIHMFAFTVAENVSMRHVDQTDRERVHAALQRAGLDGKIEALPRGIETPVLKVIHKNGTEFSGGESQKLALARALYKSASVVILDEPTASLDAMAEARLYRDFDALIQNRTAIYISHRLASTRFCDRVVVFEDGRIIENGTHEQLMAGGGRYAELFALQAKYYQQEERSGRIVGV